MATAGKFSCHVSDPWPVWLELVHEGAKGLEVQRFSHKELRDLKHVVDAAIREAAAKLDAAEARANGLDIAT